MLEWMSLTRRARRRWRRRRKIKFSSRVVELVGLDDCNVLDMRLQYDSEDMDDNDASNLDDMDIGDGGFSSSQCLEPNTSPAAEPLQSSIRVHSDRPSEATLSIHDPLFNAAGKALHLDVVFVKQDDSWFQLREDKRQRKTTKKLALQHEKDRIAKKRKDSKRTIAYLQDLLQKKLEGDIDILLAGNLRVPITKPTLSLPTPSL